MLVVMFSVVIVAVVGAVVFSLLTTLSRLPDDDYDYIRDWTEDDSKRKR